MHRLTQKLWNLSGTALVVAYFAFLLAPIAIMIPSSFSSGEIVEFPPREISLRWYEFVVTSDAWRSSAWVSLRIAVAATILSTAAGMLVGFAIYRFGKINSFLRLAYLSPILIPHIVVAAGLFDILVPLHLLGSEWVLAVGHATMSLPLSVVVAIGAFETLERTYWTAANTLGARWHQIVGMIILPIISTNIIACMILAFENSWHEVTLALLIGPGLTPTLPSKLFSLLAQENSPAFAAISTLLLMVTLVLGAVLALAPRRKPAGPTSDDDV